jgi:hypothetical protein
MTNRLIERLTTVLLYLRSGGQTTAIVLDLSLVPNIDFTGALAIKSILDEAKPASRNVPLGHNGKTVKRPYFGTLIYVVEVPTAVQAVLVNGGLFRGKLEHGAWSLLQCPTIEEAVESFALERSRVCCSGFLCGGPPYFFFFFFCFCFFFSFLNLFGVATTRDLRRFWIRYTSAGFVESGTHARSSGRYSVFDLLYYLFFWGVENHLFLACYN